MFINLFSNPVKFLTEQLSYGEVISIPHKALQATCLWIALCSVQPLVGPAILLRKRRCNLLQFDGGNKGRQQFRHNLQRVFMFLQNGGAGGGDGGVI
jgi:hypothetical protein